MLSKMASDRFLTSHSTVFSKPDLAEIGLGSGRIVKAWIVSLQSTDTLHVDACCTCTTSTLQRRQLVKEVRATCLEFGIIV